MTCKSCGEPNKKCSCKNGFTKAVIEINNPESLVLFRKVVIPASMGDDTTVPPAIGKYHNVLLKYDANNHIYIYSSDGIPTLLEAPIPQEVWDRMDELQDEIDDIRNNPDVVDIVATYAALQAYDTSTLTDNDIVRVLADETHDGQSTYYRWDADTSSWTYIGTIGNYYTKSEVDELINGAREIVPFYINHCAYDDWPTGGAGAYKDDAYTIPATEQDIVAVAASGQVPILVISGRCSYTNTETIAYPLQYFRDSDDEVDRVWFEDIDYIYSTSNAGVFRELKNAQILRAIGDLTSLTTTNKNSLVAAINEVDAATNLVVYLPNGMTEYLNNDAPIDIEDAWNAVREGKVVTLVDDYTTYTVTSIDIGDGTLSMRADQVGLNKHLYDGYWHISGGGDIWSSVEFVHDAIPAAYYINSWGVSSSTWSALKSSDPINGDNDHRMYYPASSDATFTNDREDFDASGLWQKLFSGDYVTLSIPLQDISNASTSLVDTGFTKDDPNRSIDVTLSPANWFSYNDASQAPNIIMSGYLTKNVSLGLDGEKEFIAGIVKVVDNGNTTYSFVVSLTETKTPAV